jgi:hypothetical protein
VGPAPPSHQEKLWDNAWEEFIPFLDYDVEIRKVLCSTNAIESLNARYRRAVRARDHFPNEQSAMKTLYLVTRSLDPKGTGQTRWAARWKPALNAFAVTFRRLHAGRRRKLIMETATYTVRRTVPRGSQRYRLVDSAVGRAPPAGPLGVRSCRRRRRR